MKAVKITLGGQEYHLLFNGAAMFATDDAFGSGGKILDVIGGNGKESFDALCKAVSILGEQGELARRALGYDKGEIPSEETVKALASPVDSVVLKRAVLNAITIGYGREVRSDEPTDLGLVELERKQGKD